MKIFVLESDGWKASLISRDAMKKLVKEYAGEASKILGDISRDLNIIIKPNLPHVSSTKGVGGSTYDHELIDITFDPLLPFGLKNFKKYLKEAIFHELNHTLYMKYNPREDRQLYWTILEGLGVAFDTEYAEGDHFAKGEVKEEAKNSWALKYHADSVSCWDTPNDGMMYDVGAWIVRRAEKNSGKGVVELTRLSCDEVLKLSEIQ